MDQFFVDAVQTAFEADGLNFSHPIIQVVSDPDEINSLFDSISYDKVGVVICMMSYDVIDLGCLFDTNVKKCSW